MSRPTMSRDGKRRMSVAIKYRFDRADVTRILCLGAAKAGDWQEYLPERGTRTWIDKAVRNVIRTHGLEATYWWEDHAEDGDAAEIEAQVEDLIHEAMPELD